MSTAHILVVDDEPDIRNLLKEILQDEGYEVTVADGAEKANAARRARRPDLVLLDIWMPDVDGITLLKEWGAGGTLPCPVIMMSGHGTVETAVEATRLGAYDFIEKPLSMAKLLLTVQHALEADKLHKENIGLRRQVQPLIEPVGKSTVMTRLREQVRRIAQHETWVLISGEPGSGKHTCARYLHSLSARRDGPFVEVGVASIATQNSAVELFGSEDDAGVHYGLLEQANTGVLYLNEAGEMDIATQGRLLSALQNRRFLRVGGSQPVQIDVRVIASTSQNLGQAVQDGRFREDLYYHLNVVPLHIPSLREHCEDVPELLSFYVSALVEQENLPYRRFSTAAQNRLRNYHWPGSIRELKNLVQRLLILGSGEEIGLEEVEAIIQITPARTQPALQMSFDQPLREAREQFERAYLLHQLHECGGSIGRLAKLSGMERTHLYRKLKALGIDVKKSSE